MGYLTNFFLIKMGQSLLFIIKAGIRTKAMCQALNMTLRLLEPFDVTLCWVPGLVKLAPP